MYPATSAKSKRLSILSSGPDGAFYRKSDDEVEDPLRILLDL
jgi:hypothetical protein